MTNRVAATVLAVIIPELDEITGVVKGFESRIIWLDRERVSRRRDAYRS